MNSIINIIDIQAIGEKIALAEYDVYLLAELWMRPDHATIEASLPEVFIIIIIILILIIIILIIIIIIVNIMLIIIMTGLPHECVRGLCFANLRWTYASIILLWPCHCVKV